MVISKRLNELKMSQYRLSKESGIPQATISDICSEKSSLENCSVGTVFKIAKALNISLDDLMSSFFDEKENNRMTFETFRGNICHLLKSLGDVAFIEKIILNDEILDFYNRKMFLHSFYLLAMVDYLSRINDIPLYTKYNALRKEKLNEMVFTNDVILKTKLYKTNIYKEEAIKHAIPEFLKFNIAEGGIRDVE